MFTDRKIKRGKSIKRNYLDFKRKETVIQAIKQINPDDTPSEPSTLQKKKKKLHDSTSTVPKATKLIKAGSRKWFSGSGVE